MHVEEKKNLIKYHVLISLTLNYSLRVVLEYEFINEGWIDC